MSAHIRPAAPEDADELARLRWDFRVEHGTPVTRDFAEFVAEFRSFAAETLVDGSGWRAWVAEGNGGVVGCVWLQLVERVPHPGLARWERPIAYLTSMYVGPDLRNSGLGRELLDVALEFARDAGVDGVALWPSPKSAPFYERAGFRPDGGPLWLEIAGD